MLVNVGISAPRYFAQRWPDRKRRAVAECAAGRTAAEVAATVGAARAEVERWCAAPDFTVPLLLSIRADVAELRRDLHALAERVARIEGAMSGPWRPANGTPPEATT